MFAVLAEAGAAREIRRQNLESRSVPVDPEGRLGRPPHARRQRYRTGFDDRGVARPRHGRGARRLGLLRRRRHRRGHGRHGGTDWNTRKPREPGHDHQNDGFAHQKPPSTSGQEPTLPTTKRRINLRRRHRSCQASVLASFACENSDLATMAIVSAARKRLKIVSRGNTTGQRRSSRACPRAAPSDQADRCLAGNPYVPEPGRRSSRRSPASRTAAATRSAQDTAERSAGGSVVQDVTIWNMNS